MLEPRLLDVDEIGQLEAALERPPGETMMKILRIVIAMLLPGDGQQILLRRDRELVRGEAGDRDGDAVGVLALLLDVARWIIVARLVAGCVLHQVDHAFETDDRAIERRKIEFRHIHILL